jgi:hypothetical protein
LNKKFLLYKAKTAELNSCCFFVFKVIHRWGLAEIYGSDIISL